MARIVVIFAILSLIAGAMFWFARHPGFSNHGEPSVTLPVKAPEQSAEATSTPAAPAAPAAADASAPPAAAPTGADALPPSEANASGITLNATGAEANVLQQQMTTAQTGLVVESVEPAGDNSLALKGRADAGATLKVSVNGKAAGEVVVGSGGAWSLSIDKGKDQGEPKIALELVGADGKVLDKTNFVYRTAAAVPPLAPQDEALITQHTSAPPKAKPVKTPRSHHATFRVRRGESLWRIARRKLGSGEKWRVLYEANRAAIGSDPDFVRAGTRLVLPS